MHSVGILTFIAIHTGGRRRLARVGATCGFIAATAAADSKMLKSSVRVFDPLCFHLTDWDDTTEYVRKEGLAICVNPSPYPRG